MVAPIYPNKKGIYRDLYAEIDSDKKKKAKETSQRRIRKGIYVELYRQIGGKCGAECILKGQEEKKQNSLYARFIQMIQKIVDVALSKATYCVSSAGNGIKMLLLACLVAKKPINSYIDNNIQTYLSQGYYYNDR